MFILYVGSTRSGHGAYINIFNRNGSKHIHWGYVEISLLKLGHGFAWPFESKPNYGTALFSLLKILLLGQNFLFCLSIDILEELCTKIFIIDWSRLKILDAQQQ